MIPVANDFLRVCPGRYDNGPKGGFRLDGLNCRPNRIPGSAEPPMPAIGRADPRL